MLRKSSLLLTIVLLFCFMAGKGQGYLSDLNTFTPKDGLSSRFIRCIHEDDQGFVWLPTDNGLNRFDGHDFKVFNTENSNLFTNRCSQVQEDVNGNIWVGYQITGKTRKIDWLSIITPDFEIRDLDDYFKNELPVPAAEIFSVERAPNKVLILMTNAGAVYKYNGKFENVAEDEKLIGTTFLQIDSTDKAYFLGKETLFIAKIGNETQLISRPSMLCLPIFKDSKVYWYNFNNLIKSPGQTKLFNETETIDFLPAHFFQDEDFFIRNMILPYYLFVSYCFKYEDFIEKYHPETGEITIVTKKLAEDYPDHSIQSGFFTRKNKFWFYGLNGLHLLTFKPNPFQNLLKGKRLSARAIDKTESDKFLIAPGIFDLDPKSGNYSDVSNEVFPPTRGVVKFGNGNYLFGTYGRMLQTYDANTGNLDTIYLKKSDRADYSGEGFLVPFKDDSNNIWVGTDNGILLFDRAEDSLQVFKKYNEFGKLAKERVSWFKEYEDGIWGASSKGIFVLQKEEGITAWHHPMPDLRIMHFWREGSVFWLATYGSGLIKWNFKTGKIKKYGLNHGLLDENVMAVYPDKRNNFWLTTNWGLARFNREKETFNVFLKSDGINHNEFNISSHFQDDDGKLFLGGLDGITAFDPNNFAEIEKDTISKFIVTSYHEVDSETLKQKDKTSIFLNKKSIVLEPGSNSFNLRFALLNYENADYTRYAYKIEGLYDEWIFQKENYIKFNRLPFGEYTIRLKATDYQGNEYDEMAIPLKIKAPFYKKMIWQFVGVLLLFGMLFGIFKQRQYRSQKEKERLEHLVNERTKELQNLNETKDRLFAILAHDLRNPVIAFEELSETINYLMQKNEPERISKLGNQIELEAKQLHHLLDNLLNWALAQREEVLIDLSTFNLKEFLTEITDAFMPLAERSKIDLSIDCDPNIQLTTDKRLLEIVARNVLTNAFKYTKKDGRIELIGKIERGNIFFQIKDNGIGMTDEELENLFDVKRKFRGEATTATVSLGMHLCKELMDIIEGDISAETQIGKWTLVTMKMPIRT